jgi:hypothetical protein
MGVSPMSGFDAARMSLASRRCVWFVPRFPAWGKADEIVIEGLIIGA